MKKLGLLIGGAFILAACDASPGGNRDILPVVHDEPVEHVEHHAEDIHNQHTEEAAQEANDSTTVTTSTHSENVENPTTEPQDSAH